MEPYRGAMPGDSSRTGPAEPDAHASAQLPRVLGPFDAVAMVVGGIIGSGIFLKPGVVASELGSFGLIISVWIFVGFITLCGALTLAELAAMLPHAGGPYVYLREAFGRLPAFLWGWTELSIIRPGSVGALATATVIYLNEIVPMNRHWQEATAIGIVIFLSIVNVVGTRWGAAVQNLTVVAKLVFLVFIIALPFAMSPSQPIKTAPWPDEFSLSIFRGLGMAMIAVMWPYDGWINIAPVAEEIREPQRNVPLGLALGMAIVIVVYVLANVAYHAVLSIPDIARSEAVAHDMCTALLGEKAGKLVSLGVLCSTFGAANSNLLTGPRIYFAMARDGLLPASIRRVHGRWQTPANAIWLQGGWTIVLIVAAYAWEADPRDAFDALTDFVIFGGSLFYALAVASVFVFRRRHPEWQRPYRTIGYPVTPCLYLLGISAALASMLVDKFTSTLAGTVLIAAGVAFFFWARKRTHWQVQ
ncbi:MAG TPA: amino acid permease [Pirellulales bacterium]|nr:amino acid permease [Pirellulales bacterium]